jgi:hypothetical protein
MSGFLQVTFGQAHRVWKPEEVLNEPKAAQSQKGMKSVFKYS